MKTLIVNRKTVVSILTTMLLIYWVQGISYGQGDTPTVTPGDTNTSLRVSFTDFLFEYDENAYQIQLRRKSPQGEWTTKCSIISLLTGPDNIFSARAGTYVSSTIFTDLEPGVTYEARYRDTNLPECQDNPPSPEPWSAITEGTTHLVTPPRVEFADANLATAIREALDLDTGDGVDILKIPKAELTKLTRLSIRVATLSDLTGLEHATQLITLSLGGRDITDLTPLAQLTELTKLTLSSNEISDISPLAELTELRELSLSSNEISDISPLAELTELRELSLSFNRISDISPLTQLIELTTLSLHGNQISDITALTQLTKLTLLGLTVNQISDISPLAQLKKLTFLQLGHNQVRDITPLAQTESLTEVHLDHNQIRDVTPLAQLTYLEKLSLRDNQIRDVTPLAKLSESLMELNLRDNRIRDVSPLAGLIYLEELKLRDNSITDTYPLSALLDENPNLDIDIEVITEEGGPTITVSTSQLLTATTLNGSVVTLTLSSGAFNHLRSGIRDALTISGITGITYHRTDIDRVSDTEVRIKLTFDGTIEADTTLTVTVGSGAIKDFTGPAQTAQIPVSASEEIPDTGGLVASTAFPLTKATLDGSTVILMLQDKSYELGGNFSAADGGVRVTGIAGVTVRGFGLDVFRLSDTKISVRLNFDGDFDVDKTLTFLVSPEIIANYNGPSLTAKILVAAGETPITPEIPISAATLKFLPSPVQSPAVGEQLTLSINIANGENVAAYQATVQFDDSALRYISSAIGDFLPAGAFPLPAEASGNTVTLAAVSLTGESAGDGTLATITFEVIAVKESTLTLSGVLLSDSAETASRPQVEAGLIVEQPQLIEDVNGDGVVNILDLVRVASSFGGSGENGADVNGDGVVNILDLVLVAGAFGNAAAAPSADPRALAMLTATDVGRWLAQAGEFGLVDKTAQRGVLFLEQLLAALTPKETALLPNYPNPFNPETWIPYGLANDTHVQISIYDISGELVRQLDLGHQRAGHYTERSRAAYWDGRNGIGEHVASGVYFYTLTAGDFTATRKMLIGK